jgi:hypothetical protein
MTTPSLQALRAAVLTNTLSPAMQEVLVEAIDAAGAFVNVPDAVADTRAEPPWVNGLYALAALDGGSGMGSFAASISVPNAAALEAFAPVTGFPDGSRAYTETFGGALWSLEPAGQPLAPGLVLPASDNRVWTRIGPANPELAMAQATWVFDPVAGNDEASGLTAGTALQTFAEFLRRCGTLTPKLAQDTTFTWESSDAALADEIVFRPIVANRARVLVQGTPQLVQTTAITVVQSKNRALGTGHNLRVNLGASGAAGQLVVNLTHPSRAWAYQLVSGTTFTMDQPFLDNNLDASEVDTWTTGDQAELFTIPRINLAVFEPTFLDVAGTFDNWVQLQNLVIGDPTSVGASPLRLGSSVQLQDVRSERTWVPTSVSQQIFAMAWVNVGFDGSIIGYLGSSTNVCTTLLGGHVHGGDAIFMVGINLDGDIILDATGVGAGDAVVRDAVLGWVNMIGPRIDFGGACRLTTFFGSGGALWGAAAMNFLHDGNFNYVGTAVSRFLSSGAMSLGGVVSASSRTTATGAVTINAGIALTPTNLDAATGAAGFGGCAFQLSGGVVQNVAAA